MFKMFFSAPPVNALALFLSSLLCLTVQAETSPQNTTRSSNLSVGSHWTTPYNVTWTEQSKDSSGSMPLGNGDIGLNVWVEESGDLLFYIGKSDAWDENCINSKLARVRVKFSPNPFVKGQPFRQTLVLKDGGVEITAGDAGSAITTRLWVDANQPVVRVESHGETPFTQEVILETWRNNESTVGTEVSDLFHNLDKKAGDPYPTIIFPDTVVPGRKDRLIWYHHNIKPKNDPYMINLTLQGMESYAKQIPHPLLDRTFGAAIKGVGYVSTSDKSLKTDHPARDQNFSIYPLTMHPSTEEQWSTMLDTSIQKIDALDPASARKAHLAWWEAFWDRSWIRITSPSGDVAAAEVSRAYQLCRYMNACAGRGAQPIKFNGSLFTVGTPKNPDYRRWGGPGYWFQNSRLIYWPMLSAGDFDLMEPWFRMYRETLPFAKARTQKYFQHDGAFFGETILFWGAEASGHYGWTPFEKRKSPLCECSYLTYYWNNNLENLAMMLDYWSHTGSQDFAKNTLLPHAEEITRFYDLHYPRDPQGKLHFDPAQSLETWHTAVNPLPEIAGLKAVLPRLLALPEHLTTPAMRDRWQKLLREAPNLPTGLKMGKNVLLPAETFSQKANVENPELYSIFPYRLHGVGKPDLQLARDTFSVRTHRQTFCWCQNDTQAALLGLAEEAKEIVCIRSSKNAYKTSRFPAFWSSNYDWVPDIDHGGNLQLALQFMLMQCDDTAIRLLPAWPKGWDAEFKLHAPHGTIVEGKAIGGKIVDLKVTPNERKKDVVVD